MAGVIFGGQGFLILVAVLVVLAVVIYAFVKVIQSPGLSMGAKWAWALGIGVGFWVFWLPGVVLAIVFLVMKGRWQGERELTGGES